jgi:hypothetical protein
MEEDGSMMSDVFAAQQTCVNALGLAEAAEDG